jgi:hypothetical protein
MNAPEDVKDLVKRLGWHGHVYAIAWFHHQGLWSREQAREWIAVILENRLKQLIERR